MNHFLTLLMCSFLSVHSKNLVEGQDQGPIEVPEVVTVPNQNSEQQNDADSSEQFESSWEYLKTFCITELFKAGFFEGSRVYVRGVGLLVLFSLGLWLASDHLGIWRTLRGASKTRGVRQLLEGFEAKQRATSLSEGTVEVLKACHPLLKDVRRVIGKAFYNRLFKEYPQVKPLFSQSDAARTHQTLALADALIAFTGRCDDLPSLLPMVQRVSMKHVNRGVTAEMYPWVGITLLKTLEEVLGKEVFTESVGAAVAEGYIVLSGIFINTEAALTNNNDNRSKERGM